MKTGWHQMRIKIKQIIIHPYTPLPEGNKKSNNERLLKKIPLQRRSVK